MYATWVPAKTRPFRITRWQMNARGAWSVRTVLDLHQGRTRSDLLFTMSDNTRTSGKAVRTRILIHFWTSKALLRRRT
jgi:hypothetical protein